MYPWGSSWRAKVLNLYTPPRCQIHAGRESSWPCEHGRVQTLLTWVGRRIAHDEAVRVVDAPTVLVDGAHPGKGFVQGPVIWQGPDDDVKGYFASCGGFCDLDDLGSVRQGFEDVQGVLAAENVVWEEVPRRVEVGGIGGQEGEEVVQRVEGYEEGVAAAEAAAAGARDAGHDYYL